MTPDLEVGQLYRTHLQMVAFSLLTGAITIPAKSYIVIISISDHNLVQILFQGVLYKLPYANTNLTITYMEKVSESS